MSELKTLSTGSRQTRGHATHCPVLIGRIGVEERGVAVAFVWVESNGSLGALTRLFACPGEALAHGIG